LTIFLFINIVKKICCREMLTKMMVTWEGMRGANSLIGKGLGRGLLGLLIEGGAGPAK
jgi:hypothetical protein